MAAIEDYRGFDLRLGMLIQECRQKEGDKTILEILDHYVALIEEDQDRATTRAPTSVLRN